LNAGRSDLTPIFAAFSNAQVVSGIACRQRLGTAGAATLPSQLQCSTGVYTDPCSSRRTAGSYRLRLHAAAAKDLRRATTVADFH